MRKLVYFLLFFVVVTLMCLSMSGCKDVKPVQDSIAVDTTVVDSVSEEEEVISETPMPRAADELFDDFVFNFAANRSLQMSRIAFPLKVFKNGAEAAPLQKAQWKMEYFFMRQDYYTLIFDSEKQISLVKDTAINHAVIEHINLNQKSVKQYVFDRMNGLWMLTSLVYVPTSKTPNASFLDFYQKFSTDKDFQLESMAEEVSFTCPDPDDDFGTMTGTFLPEQWPAFAPDLIPSGSIWNILYGSGYKQTNLKVFLLRGIANGLEMEMIFKKTGGNWKLTKLNT